jgi:branched-chain amino acid transport system substrate-binding protein
MKPAFRIKAAALAVAVAAAVGGIAEVAAQSNEIFIPVLVYRTGAYAPNGVPWADGYVDYLKLVNERDGGVNGVKLAFEECETGYATDRGVECYERLKSKKGVLVNPLSTGITYALTEKVPGDKIVLFSTGYGRADSVDGSVFQWNFPLLGTYWDAADMLVQHVKKKGSLKGKKIALVYHDSPYGRSRSSCWRSAPRWKASSYPAAGDAPGCRAEGDLAASAPATSRLRLPVGLGRDEFHVHQGGDRRVLSAPADVWRVVVFRRARRDARRRRCQGVQRHRSGAFLGARLPVHKDMIKYLYDKGKGTAANKSEVGDVLYNRGMISAMLSVEAIRPRRPSTASARHRRGSAMGRREPEPRRGEGQGARLWRHGPAAQDLLQRPRWRAPWPRAYVGRQAVELHVRLV